MDLKLDLVARRILTLTALCMTTSGCDERVVEVAREASDRQAAQNLQMAELQQEVAGGTRALVKAEAEARREFSGMHRDLQLERRQLSESWTDLELERRRVDRQRHLSSGWQATLVVLVSIAFAIALLGFLWQLLAQARTAEPAGEELQELLVEYLLPPGGACPGTLLPEARPPAHAQPSREIPQNPTICPSRHSKGTCHD